MQQVSREGLLFELKPQSLEDLWILSQFITPNDRVFATTQRKIKVGNSENAKTVTKLIYVELETQKTSFEHEVLRVSGKIQNETEFTAVGSNHTLSFSINEVLKIEKKNLLNFEEKILKQSIETKKSLSLLVLLDKDELIATEFGAFSYKVLFEKKGLGSKKYTEEEINENEEKYNILKPFLGRDYSNIILAGPNTFKDNLKKYLIDKGVKCISFNYPDVGSYNIQKAIKEVNESGVLSDSQLSRESEMINKLLINIDKNEKNSYSYKDVEASINEGKVDVLLISSKLIDKYREEEKYTDLNKLMVLTELLNGSLVIFQSGNEPGKILDGLGSIASINRY